MLILSSLGAGGAERVITLLANHRAALGDDVCVVSFDAGNDGVFHSFDSRVRLLRLNLRPLGFGRIDDVIRVARRIARLRALMRHEDPDLVISFLFKINVTTLIAAMGLRGPVAVAERNHPGQQQGHWLWGVGRDIFYRRACQVVLQTEGSKRAVSPSIAARSVVIYNPITSFDRPPSADDGAQLVAVGRLDQQKGFDLLLEAFARVAARHPQWQVTIWGEGPRRDDLEAQRRQLGLDGRVAMPGLSEYPGSWAAAATVFVLSSRFEGFGNAMGEAMSAGLPVAAFNCEFGVAEVITPEVDGLVVPPEDVDALAGALDRLMADGDLRRRLGEAARLSSRRFQPETIFAHWDQLIAICLATDPQG